MSDDAITSAIEGAMAAAAPTAEPAAEPVAEPAAESAAEPVEGAAEGAVAEEHAEGEPAAEEHAEPAGQLPTEPQKKRGPIPFDRHQAVLTKARREAEQAQQALQQRIDALSKYETQDYQERLRAMELAETRPDVFVQILRADPRYQQYLREEQAKQEAAVEAAAAEPPAPDAILPDGSLGYSAEGARKLLDWRMAQERGTFEKQMKALRDELSPVKETFEAQRQYSQSLQKMSGVLEEARSQWPDFSENEAGIKAALVANPTWSLERAYISVVGPALKNSVTQAETAARKKVVAEMTARANAAKSTTPPGGVPAAVVQAETPGDSDTRIEAAIRASMAALK